MNAFCARMWISCSITYFESAPGKESSLRGVKNSFLPQVLSNSLSSKTSSLMYEFRNLRHSQRKRLIWTEPECDRNHNTLKVTSIGWCEQKGSKAEPFWLNCFQRDLKGCNLRDGPILQYRQLHYVIRGSPHQVSRASQRGANPVLLLKGKVRGSRSAPRATRSGVLLIRGIICFREDYQLQITTLSGSCGSA